MKLEDRAQRLHIKMLHSRHLEKNKLGDPADRQMTIWLPPSYHKSKTQRYPVAYLLHGFGECAWGFAGNFMLGTRPQWPSVLDSFDDFMKRKKCAEMIVVLPDGTNRWGCSQWVDSGINGNYDKYVAEDVVGFIDGNYRTIPDRRYRMVGGVSSGGFGAFHIAGGNPDVFGAVAIRSADMYFEVTHIPWLMDLVNESYPKGFRGPIAGKWLTWFCYAGAAAYAPNPRKKPIYGDLPIRFPTGEIIANNCPHPTIETLLGFVPCSYPLYHNHWGIRLRTLREYRSAARRGLRPVWPSSGRYASWPQGPTLRVPP